MSKPRTTEVSGRAWVSEEKCLSVPGTVLFSCTTLKGQLAHSPWQKTDQDPSHTFQERRRSCAVRGPLPHGCQQSWRRISNSVAFWSAWSGRSYMEERCLESYGFLPLCIYAESLHRPARWGGTGLVLNSFSYPAVLYTEGNKIAKTRVSGLCSKAMLCNAVPSRYMWPLSTWNVAGQLGCALSVKYTLDFEQSTKKKGM